MNSQKFESTLSSLLLLGSAGTSIFLVLNVVSDPVNAPKMFALGSLGFALAGLVLTSCVARTWRESKALLCASILFLAAMINSIINSHSPFIQNLYGVYGRNTGFITYLSLVFLLLGALQIRRIRTFEILIYGFFFVGAINVLYCGWALVFGDFIPWNNPYKSILGLFGNPDFVSAYLGMFISALSVFFFFGKVKLWIKLSGIAIAIFAFIEIIKSHAIQGIAVSALGVGIVLFFFIRSKAKTMIPPLLYGLVGIGLGIIGILGALQTGPLKFIYKKSVSLRGSYWRAGINMGNEHPLTGVGMDAYGDSYKAARPAAALIDTPGPKTVSNAAHNVFIDIFSYGGWPLILSYIAILSVTVIAVYRVIKRMKTYEPIFITLLVIWATYLIQSIISINQIGLAVWGWVASGSLISYEILARKTGIESSTHSGKIKKVTTRKSNQVITPNLIAGIGLLIGILISLPPLSGDLKWRSALISRNIANVEAALVPSYLNPASSFKYGTFVSLLSENGFNDKAYKYAKIAVEFNPDFSDAWLQLYSLPQSTPAEKENALKNIRRLDPNNPDPLGLK